MDSVPSQSPVVERPANPPNTHVNKWRYLLQVLKQDPLELLRLAAIALVTAKFRFIIGCIGPGTLVGLHTEIVNSGNVRIGRGCLLQDAVYIRAGTQGKVTIGDRAALNSFCRIFGHGGVDIGDDAQIGPGTLITTTDHNVYQDLEVRFKPVVIGKRAWVGANVTILPGVRVGEYAVVGAGSVVTRDVPPRTVAVGVPAKVVKELALEAKSEEPGKVKQVEARV